MLEGHLDMVTLYPSLWVASPTTHFLLWDRYRFDMIDMARQTTHADFDTYVSDGIAKLEAMANETVPVAA
jgi:hypothetical protein